MRAACQTNFVLSKVSVVETLIGQDTVGAKLKVEQKLADAVGQLKKIQDGGSDRRQSRRQHRRQQAAFILKHISVFEHKSTFQG